MAVNKQKVTTFECKPLEADNVTDACDEYERLINQHMNEPRSKFVDGQQVYMLPVKYEMKKIDDTFVVEITFVGANKINQKTRV